MGRDPRAQRAAKPPRGKGSQRSLAGGVVPDCRCHSGTHLSTCELGTLCRAPETAGRSATVTMVGGKGGGEGRESVRWALPPPPPPPPSLSPQRLPTCQWTLPTCHKQQVEAVLGEVARRSDRQGTPSPLPPHCTSCFAAPWAAAGHCWIQWPWHRHASGRCGGREPSGEPSPGCAGCLEEAPRKCCPFPKPVSWAARHPWLYSPSQIAQSGSPQFRPPG